MFKLSLATLTLAIGLSAGVAVAADNNNKLDAEFYGRNIDADIRMLGKNMDLDVLAVGKDQRIRMVTGTCPEGTKPAPVVITRSGLTVVIPYCEIE